MSSLGVSTRVVYGGLPAFKGAVIRAARKGVGQAAAVGAGAIKSGLGRGARFSPSPAGSPPNTQRGQLRNSITSRLADGVTPVAYAGVLAPARVPYALVHELGLPRVIRPKKGKYLKVPVNNAAKREDERGGNMPATFIPRRGRSPLLIGVDKSRYRSKIAGLSHNTKPIWVLKEQIVTRPRPFIRPAIDRARPQMLVAFQNGFKAEMSRSGTQ